VPGARKSARHASTATSVHLTSYGGSCRLRTSLWPPKPRRPQEQQSPGLLRLANANYGL
jgi:hypothetical protein